MKLEKEFWSSASRTEERFKHRDEIPNGTYSG